MKKKAIFALSHIANRGKTETLRQLAFLLQTAYPNSRQRIPAAGVGIGSGDFRLVLEIDGLVVAVESQGDPHTGLRERLNELVAMGVDVIFCSTRTKGDTVSAAEEIAEQGFEPIWTSTYQTVRDHQQVNTLKARHLMELARTLNYLP